MPAPTDTASVTRAPAAAEAGGDDALCFAGALSRANAAALFKRLPALDGVRTLDLRQVTSVDSAGLALLAEVAARTGASTILGAPAGLAELRSAYRLDSGLGFGNEV